MIFSTKDRQPLLSPEIRPSVHAYLATVMRDHDCTVYRVGGTWDHVHLAFAISRKMTIAALVETIKVASSKWIKQEFPVLKNFAWQNGYGAFSIGASEIDKLIRYIDMQEEHHRPRTFQEEYREFLKKYEIKYDERYVWD
jgi:REP element-mobilizing transposase RayT